MLRERKSANPNSAPSAPIAQATSNYGNDAKIAPEASNSPFGAVNVVMRTTLEIRDDVLEQMKAYAAARSISNGAAASDLIQRGLTAEVPTTWENGLLVFDPGPSGFVTLEHTLAVEDS